MQSGGSTVSTQTAVERREVTTWGEGAGVQTVRRRLWRWEDGRTGER